MIEEDHLPTRTSSLDHAEWLAYLRHIRHELASLSPAAAQCLEWAEDIVRREGAAGIRAPATASTVALRQ